MDPITLSVILAFILGHVVKEVGDAIASGYRAGAKAGKARTAKMRQSANVGDNMVGAGLDGVGAVIGGTVRGARAVGGAVGRGARKGWQAGKDKVERDRAARTAAGDTRPWWKRAADWCRDRAQGRPTGKPRLRDRLRDWWREGREDETAEQTDRPDDPPADGDPGDGGTPPPPSDPPPPPGPPTGDAQPTDPPVPRGWETYGRYVGGAEGWGAEPVPPSPPPPGQPEQPAAVGQDGSGLACIHPPEHTNRDETTGVTTCDACGAMWGDPQPEKTGDNMPTGTAAPSGEVTTFTQARQAAGQYHGLAVRYVEDGTTARKTAHDLRDELMHIRDSLAASNVGPATLGPVAAAVERAEALARTSMLLVATASDAVAAADQVTAALDTHIGIAEAAAAADGGDRQYYGGKAEK